MRNFCGYHQSFFYYQLMQERIVLKGLLQFTLKLFTLVVTAKYHLY